MSKSTNPRTIDLVICGPDMSGTSTQIQDAIDFYKRKGLVVRDIRGTETDALFHTQDFWKINQKYSSWREFFEDPTVPMQTKIEFDFNANAMLRGTGTHKQDLLVASMVRNQVSAYIDPDTAEVWVMEEPTRRGAGQVNRAVEQNMSSYGSEMNQTSAAVTHSVYRKEEFLRFRGSLRERGKIIIRSRSEESACYNVFDKDHIQSGIQLYQYLTLPGHRFAFGHPPTHLFVVCGKEDWTEEDIIRLRKERAQGRRLDDYEKDLQGQLLVNKRYASDWLEQLYEQGCGMHGSNNPQIYRFDIMLSKEEMRDAMHEQLELITRSR